MTKSRVQFTLPEGVSLSADVIPRELGQPRGNVYTAYMTVPRHKRRRAGSPPSSASAVRKVPPCIVVPVPKDNQSSCSCPASTACLLMTFSSLSLHLFNSTHARSDTGHGVSWNTGTKTCIAGSACCLLLEPTMTGLPDDKRHLVRDTLSNRIAGLCVPLIPSRVYFFGSDRKVLGIVDGEPIPSSWAPASASSSAAPERQVSM